MNVRHALAGVYPCRPCTTCRPVRAPRRMNLNPGSVRRAQLDAAACAAGLLLPLLLLQAPIAQATGTALGRLFFSPREREQAEAAVLADRSTEGAMPDRSSLAATAPAQASSAQTRPFHIHGYLIHGGRLILWGRDSASVNVRRWRMPIRRWSVCNGVLRVQFAGGQRMELASGDQLLLNDGVFSSISVLAVRRTTPVHTPCR